MRDCDEAPLREGVETTDVESDGVALGDGVADAARLCEEAALREPTIEGDRDAV